VGGVGERTARGGEVDRADRLTQVVVDQGGFGLLRDPDARCKG
jgi:hypothetical protein